MIVIIKTANGPVRMDMDNFRPVEHELAFPVSMPLSVKSALADDAMRHFIVDDKGRDAWGEGFLSRDDADLILSEIKNGWTLSITHAFVEQIEQIKPAVPVKSDDEPPLPLANPIPPGSKAVKIDKVWMILDPDSNPVVLGDRANSFAKEDEVYEYMLKAKA